MRLFHSFGGEKQNDRSDDSSFSVMEIPQSVNGVKGLEVASPDGVVLAPASLLSKILEIEGLLTVTTPTIQIVGVFHEQNHEGKNREKQPEEEPQPGASPAILRPKSAECSEKKYDGASFSGPSDFPFNLGQALFKI
jgi:hypothetical protein